MVDLVSITEGSLRVRRRPATLRLAPGLSEKRFAGRKADNEKGPVPKDRPQSTPGCHAAGPPGRPCHRHQAMMANSPTTSTGAAVKVAICTAAVPPVPSAS